MLFSYLASKEHYLCARKIEARKVRNREISGDDGDALLVLELTHKLVCSGSDIGNDDVSIFDEFRCSMGDAVLCCDIEVDSLLRVAHEHGASERDRAAANASNLPGGFKGNEVVTYRYV